MNEPMNNLTRTMGFMLVALLVAACSSTTMLGSWSNSDYKGQIKNIYILGIAEKELNRRIFEDTFGRNLSSQGVKTVSSYQSIPKNQETNEDVIKQTMTSNGCDSILMTQLTGQRKETVTNPGYATGGYSSGYGGRGGYGGGYGGGWGNYYGRSSDFTYMPSTTTDFVIVTIESVLYDLKTEEMIWSAQLEVVVEESIEKMVQDFAEVVTKDLKAKGLI